MDFYIVTKEGVYRHEIKGCFQNSEQAVECAVACAENDVDDYHTYLVSIIELGVTVEDARSFCEIIRSDATIKRDFDGISAIVEHKGRISIEYNQDKKGV